MIGMSRESTDIRVLIADDDADTRAFVRAYLESEGYRVLEAMDGAEAVEHVQSAARAFDVAVLDIQMPNCDGLAALRAIKQHSSELPVVIMTGSAEPHEVREAYARGAVRVLRKPIALGDLGLVLERLTSERR